MLHWPTPWESIGTELLSMIKSLKINNIAVIQELDVEFREGMTVLTGETGAGKSILVDALSLILGVRSSSGLVRTGEERAVVEALAEIDEAPALLDAHGLPADGTDVVVRREVLANGKGRATVNGALVSLNVLRELAPRLCLIHGQHEPQGLLNPATHLVRLDSYAGLDPELGALARTFGAWREATAALEALRGSGRDVERRREMLEYQAAEIEKAELVPGEEDRLRRDKTVQANAGRLAVLAEEAYAALYEEETAVLARLGQIQRKLHELASVDPALAPMAESLPAARAQLDDVALSLRDYKEGLTVVPGRIDEIEARLATVDRLKKKYGATADEVIEFGRACRAELSALGHPEEQERALEEQRARFASEFLATARAVSKRRREAAVGLEKAVLSELKQLAMEKTRFRVRFEPESQAAAEADPARWTAAGLESAEFLMSPNPGEELRPLARIASGGELSRVMLGLMSAARLEGAGVTLVFDEADSGIGGAVAEVVGRKLKAMAARHQVLAVTHLPQIASLADDHFVVSKRVERGRTITEVRRLSPAERVEEVARMLGGETITERARDHAREMLNQNLRINS